MDRPTTPVELLELWRQRARESQLAHYKLVTTNERRSFWFGATATIISGIVGLLVLVTDKMDMPP